MRMSVWGDGNKPSLTSKILIIIGVIILILAGLSFGLIGGLLGAFLGSVVLRKTGVVSSYSAWTEETKALKIAKYILLGIVILAIMVFAYFIFRPY